MRMQLIIGTMALVWLTGAVPPLAAEEAPVHQETPVDTEASVDGDDSAFYELIAAGAVEETDMAAGWMIVDGYRYRFAPDARVQIGGSASAVGLIAPGMRLQVRYLQAVDGSRELVEAREIPPGVRIEGN